MHKATVISLDNVRVVISHPLDSSKQLLIPVAMFRECGYCTSDLTEGFEIDVYQDELGFWPVSLIEV